MAAPRIGITTSRAPAPPGKPGPFVPYTEATLRAGGAPHLIPPDADEQRLREVFDSLDGILFSGGGDVEPSAYGSCPTAALRSVDRHRDVVEITLVRWAVEGRKPFLGICRGLQVVNVALGGSLIQDIASEVRQALPHDQPDPPTEELVHEVAVHARSILRSLVARDRLQTNSFHHQSVRQLGSGLAVSARSDDGIIEAVELTGHPFGLAVQWHPERLLDQPPMQALFTGLTEAASRG